MKLLTGTDVPEAHWIEEQKRDNRKEPFAVRSLLGWMILGPSGGCNENSRQTHAIAVTCEELSERLKRMYDIGFANTKPYSK